MEIEFHILAFSCIIFAFIEVSIVDIPSSEENERTWTPREFMSKGQNEIIIGAHKIHGIDYARRRLLTPHVE